MRKRPVVLVTGSARRLGRAMALELGGHGWDVAVHYRGSADAAAQTVADLRALGVESDAFECDLSDEAACRALIPTIAAHFGSVHAVVNSASMFEHDVAATFTQGLMERCWRANTAPAIFLAQALHDLPPDDEQTEPRCVVNLLDQKLWNPNPDHLSYTLSKAALEAATPMLALALAPRVRVCGVAPGITLPSGPMTQAEFDIAHGLTPLQRSSTPDDIARTVRFLLESPAITGTTLLVDGGQHLSRQARDVLFLAQAAKG